MVPLQAQTAPEVSIWPGIISMLLMFAVFYFLLLRPQQVQQKKRREMLQALRRGDKIVTIGGIHGEITAIRDDVVTVRIAEDVEIKMSRSGIGSKRTAESQPES